MSSHGRQLLVATARRTRCRCGRQRRYRGELSRRVDWRASLVVDAHGRRTSGRHRTNRCGRLSKRGGTFLTSAGNLDAWRLRRHLRTHELISWGAPHPSLRSFEGVSGFMDSVRDALDRYEMVLPTPISLNSNQDMQSLFVAVSKDGG